MNASADLTGLTVRTIQRIENGESNPRPYALKKSLLRWQSAV